MTISCEHVDSVLSAWFEGDLDEAGRRAVDAHLRECLRCASVVRDLETISREAAKLPALAPSRDLWDGIAARIEAPVIELKTRQAPAAPRRNWQMAAAAVLLMAVSSGVTYLAVSDKQQAAPAMTASGESTDSTVPVGQTSPGVVTPKRPPTRSGSVLVGDFSAPEIIYDQEQAQFDVPMNVFSITHGMCIPTLMTVGDAATKARFVMPAVRGEHIWCQLFSEPAAGSDVAGLRTRAVKDGAGWVINGQKVWTSWAQYADYGLLLARTNPDVLGLVRARSSP